MSRSIPLSSSNLPPLPSIDNLPLFNNDSDEENADEIPDEYAIDNMSSNFASDDEEEYAAEEPVETDNANDNESEQNSLNDDSVNEHDDVDAFLAKFNRDFGDIAADALSIPSHEESDDDDNNEGSLALEKEHDAHSLHDELEVGSNDSIKSHLSAESMSDLINNLLGDTSASKQKLDAVSDASSTTESEYDEKLDIADSILQRYAQEESELDKKSEYSVWRDIEQSAKTEGDSQSVGLRQRQPDPEPEPKLQKNTAAKGLKSPRGAIKSVATNLSPRPANDQSPAKRKLRSPLHKRKNNPSTTTAPEKPTPQGESPAFLRYRSPTKSSSTRNLLAQQDRDSKTEDGTAKSPAKSLATSQLDVDQPLSPRIKQLSEPRVRTEKKSPVKPKTSALNTLTQDEIDSRPLSPRLRQLSQPRKMHQSNNNDTPLSPRTLAARRHAALEARKRIKEKYEKRQQGTEGEVSPATPTKNAPPSAAATVEDNALSNASRQSREMSPSKSKMRNRNLVPASRRITKTNSLSQQKLNAIQTALRNREKQLELQRLQDRERDETKETYARLSRIAASKDASPGERKVAMERMSLLEELIVRRVKDRLGDNEIKESTSIISPRTSKPDRTYNVPLSPRGSTSARMQSPPRKAFSPRSNQGMVSPSRTGSTVTSPIRNALNSARRNANAASPSTNSNASPEVKSQSRRMASPTLSEIRARHAERKRAQAAQSTATGETSSAQSNNSNTSPASGGSGTPKVKRVGAPSARLYSPPPPKKSTDDPKKSSTSRLSSPRRSSSPRQSLNNSASPRRTNSSMYSSNPGGNSPSSSPKPRLMEYLEKQKEGKVLSNRATIRRRELMEKLTQLADHGKEPDNAEPSSPRSREKSPPAGLPRANGKSPKARKPLTRSPHSSSTSSLKHLIESREKPSGFLSSGSRF